MYNQENPVDSNCITLHIVNVDPINDDTPSLEEIEEFLMAMKNNKSPGADNIPSEMLKAGQEATSFMLHKLLTKIWEEKQIPQEWKNAIVVPIHKKGPKSKCDNYRGISLLSVASKILSRIIYIRAYQTTWTKSSTTPNADSERTDQQ